MTATIAPATLDSLLASASAVTLLACGSFNPPTIMHLRMLECARSHVRRKGVKTVDAVLSPVADQFGKPSLAPASHRIAMTRLACGSSADWMHVSQWEATRPQWTRTLKVLQHTAEKWPGQKVLLVCGGDFVDSFPIIKPDGEPLWLPEDLEHILREFGLIVLARSGSNPLDTIQSLPFLASLTHRVSVIYDDTCPNEISSTRLRNAIANGETIRYLTPNRVIEYIKEHGLYKGSAR